MKDRLQNYSKSARIMILFFFTSTTPPSMLIISELLPDGRNFTEPLSSIDIIGAWLCKIVNDPLLPGTFIDSTSPLKSVFSGVMISRFTINQFIRF